MALSTPVKALALVVFLAAIAGATYAVQTTLGNTVEGQLLSMSTARESLNATPGHNVTYLVSVSNRDVVARDVSIEIAGAASGKSGLATVRGGATVTVFVEVNVPADIAVGEHPLDVRVLSDGRVFREREDLLQLHVLPPAPGFAGGDRAQITFTGRLAATGRVFNTNDHALVGLPIPKTDTYRFAEGVLTVVTSPRISVVPGIYEGMLGMQPGETRTFTFPPEKGYGPATEEETFNRVDLILRQLELPNDVQRVPRDAFETYVAESGQGAPGSFTVGSIFTLEQNANDWPYRIVNMTNETVEYRLAAEVGDAFTVYPFWTNASVIQSINDSTVVFFTTPTMQPGDSFTYRAAWPTFSTLDSVNETHIALKHSPPVGFTYTHVANGGQPRQATVKTVNETSVVIAIPSQNPLAGKDLTFDITMLALDKPPS